MPAEGRARIQLEPSPADATFYRFDGGEPAMLCQGRCELELPSGSTLLGLALPGQAPRPSARALDLQNGDVVAGSVSGSRNARIGIGVAGGVTMLAGLITLIVEGNALHDCKAALDEFEDACPRGSVIAGGVVFGVGGLVLPAIAAYRTRVNARVVGRDATVQDRSELGAEAAPEAAPLKTTLEECAQGEAASFMVRLDDDGAPSFLRGPQGAIRECLWRGIEGMTIPALAGSDVELEVNQP
jgi:hypothetical protein